jgi:hypothetical protein
MVFFNKSGGSGPARGKTTAASNAGSFAAKKRTEEDLDTMDLMGQRVSQYRDAYRSGDGHHVPDPGPYLPEPEFTLGAYPFESDFEKQPVASGVSQFRDAYRSADGHHVPEPGPYLPEPDFTLGAYPFDSPAEEQTEPESPELRRAIRRALASLHDAYDLQNFNDREWEEARERRDDGLRTLARGSGPYAPAAAADLERSAALWDEHLKNKAVREANYQRLTAEREAAVRAQFSHSAVTEPVASDDEQPGA